MALSRLSMKIGHAGKAAPHAAYIARLGPYANRLRRGEPLEALEWGNLPAWAQHEPLRFWEAADAYERKGGTTYREMELALPRELTPAQRLELVREFVRQELGERHAYLFAVHTPKASDGGEQPHCHLMFSERQRDGIERDPEQYFKRYNAKHPERGGCRKGYGPHAGQTLSKAERIAELKALRHRWETLCNAHLERAGRQERIDLRSHAERGTGLDPEPKQLPSQWRGAGRRAILDYRRARAELLQAQAELQALIPHPGLERSRQEIQRLHDEERRERWQGLDERALERERERLRHLTTHSLITLLLEDPTLEQARKACAQLEEEHDRLTRHRDKLRRALTRWREEHPWRARLHDSGLLPASEPVRLGRQLEALEQRLAELSAQRQEAQAHRDAVRQSTETRLKAQKDRAVLELAELEELLERRQQRDRRPDERDLGQEDEPDWDEGLDPDEGPGVQGPGFGR